jgi:antitoxin component of MazEF toxin-antitoxin module
MTTKTRILRIGNSRGIRIPKTLLDAADRGDELELHPQPRRSPSVVGADHDIRVEHGREARQMAAQYQPGSERRRCSPGRSSRAVPCLVV